MMLTSHAKLPLWLSRYDFTWLLIFLSMGLVNVACTAAQSDAINAVTFKQAKILVAGRQLDVEFADSWTCAREV